MLPLCATMSLSEKSGGHSVSTDVPYGHRYLRMGRKTVHDNDTPGHLNVLADHLSRRDQILKTEWSLNPAVARRVFRVRGSPHVDLFALKCNTKLATYMSPIPESEAWKVDSLVQTWEGLYAYAYPPTTLIRQTLNKLILHRAELILIAPLWPKQEWFPDLLRLSIDFPLVLPPTAKLLKQSFSQHFHQSPQMLNLHAWRLFVDPIKFGTEQVSNRIAVPQRKSTLDLYEQKWNTFREWCKLN